MTTQTIAINTMVRREEALRMPGELDIVKHQHEVLSKKQDPWQHSIHEVVTMDRNQQHHHTLASSPLLCPSSASSESLVTALSSFPSTPGGVSFDRIVDTSIASTFEQQPASSNGSTIGSDDTLTPGCSSLQNSQMASSSSRSSTNSSEYRHSQDDKADPRYPLESQAVPRPTSVGRESLHPSFEFDDDYESGDLSDEKVAGDPEAFEAILSCLNLPRQRTFSSSSSRDPSARLRALIQELEHRLSALRSAANTLTKELELQMAGERSKLDDLLLASIRRAVSQAHEAMVMVAWYRDTKLRVTVSPRGDAQELLGYTMGKARAFQSDEAQTRARALFDTIDAAVDSAQVGYALAGDQQESPRRNAFEAVTREHSVVPVEDPENITISKQPFDANRAASTPSIEDIARARSSTPLHFNRPASPFEPSQRRWHAQRSGASSRPPVANTKRPRCLSLSNTDAGKHGPSSLRVELLSRKLPKRPSTGVTSATHPLKESFSVGAAETLVQFPSTGPSPPPSPPLSTSNEEVGYARQSKQSLKSLRKLKLSLRPGQKECATPQSPMLSAGPSASSFQLEHQQQQQHIYFEPSRNDLSFATSPQPANPAIESKALLLHPKRPVSFATHHTTLPLPVSKLATLVKPLTRLPRHRRPAHQAEEGSGDEKNGGENSGGGKLASSFRSLWRAFSG